MISQIDAVLPMEPLWERVHKAIQSSPYFSDAQVQFETRRGDVRLHGSVGTFYEKQMAQEAIRRLDGVVRVENQLQVH